MVRLYDRLSNYRLGRQRLESPYLGLPLFRG
jgi:hypothetical protein